MATWFNRITWFQGPLLVYVDNKMLQQLLEDDNGEDIGECM
jgi:chromosomal replication initiation ATPase DnaA